jgi:beta-lactamase superfamily II metal-dependent hydrolase
MNVTLMFLDVGQGNCTLAIDHAAAMAVLIDCPSGRGRHVADLIRGSGASSIGLACVSHSHWDHLGGMYEAIRACRTYELRYNLDSVVPSGVTEARKLKGARISFAGLEDEGVKLSPAYGGDAGQVGDIGWTFISPTHRELTAAQGYGDPNYSSVVVRLEVGSIRALVTGDADGRTWRRIFDRGEDVSADIFQLPHHGAELAPGPDRAGIEEILDAVGASHHIISVGTTNSYGHPAYDTLRALGLRGDRARVMCTEVNGTCLGGAALPKPEALQLPESSLGGSGMKDRSCQCAGSVVIKVDDAGWEVSPDPATHGQVIDALGNPMCRLWQTARQASSGTADVKVSRQPS